MKKIQAAIEKLSSDIILLEITDLPALGALHSEFEQLSELLADKMNNSKKVSDKCIDLIAGIMMGDSKNPPEDIQAVKEALSHFQHVVHNNDDNLPPPNFFIEGKAVKKTTKKATKKTAKKTAKKKTSSATEIDEDFDEKIMADFIDKQSSVMESIEELSLKIEQKDSENYYAELKRAIHTIKGEAGVLQLDIIQEVTHALETSMENGQENFPSELAFKFKDWFQDYITALKNNSPAPDHESIIAAINSTEQQAKENNETTEAPAEQEGMVLEEDISFINDFVTESSEHIENAENMLLQVEQGDQSSENLNTIFRAFHTIKGIAGFLHLKDITAVTHEAENLLDKIRKGNMSFTDSAMEMCLKVLDKLKVLVKKVEVAAKESSPLMPDSDVPEITANLKKVLKGEELDNVSKATPAAAQPKTAEKPIDEKTSAEQPAEKQKALSQEESIRINTEKLDKLINMVGELVIVQAMIHQEISKYTSGDLIRNLDHMRKITRELQEISMTLRMVPLKSTFLKMSRIIRDVARKKGKAVDLIVRGEDTELDKTVVDRIGDPLVHMVRNAVDHGIEDNAEERIELGKKEKGQIELRAFHKGGNIYIEIADDGKGLDRNKLLKKAMERGMISSEDQSMDDQDVFKLIFEAGFSTASVITDVSGRGVGMDVVRKNIEALRGQIDISSELGKGTVFSIHLPLTLAIIDGMTVRCGKERYIFPTHSILTSTHPHKRDITSVAGKGEMYRLKDNLIPILKLKDLFSIADAEQEYENSILVIVEEDRKKVAFMTDEILGQQEVVIKSLGEMLQGIPGVSGGAIMPDGAVGLILDVGGLCRLT